MNISWYDSRCLKSGDARQCVRDYVYGIKRKGVEDYNGDQSNWPIVKQNMGTSFKTKKEQTSSICETLHIQQIPM